MVEALRDRLAAAGLDPSEIDRRLDVAPGSTEKLFTGERPALIDDLLSLPPLLGISPGAFLSEIEPALAPPEPDGPGFTSYEEVLELLQQKVNEAVAEEARRAGLEPPDVADPPEDDESPE